MKNCEDLSSDCHHSRCTRKRGDINQGNVQWREKCAGSHRIRVPGWSLLCTYTRRRLGSLRDVKLSEECMRSTASAVCSVYSSGYFPDTLTGTLSAYSRVDCSATYAYKYPENASGRIVVWSAIHARKAVDWQTQKDLENDCHAEKKHARERSASTAGEYT